MSTRSLVVLALTTIALTAWIAPAQAAAPEVAKSRLGTYDTSTGESYFALTLAANTKVTPAPANDLVVLFDTSASQTGLYRDDALGALRTLLKNLGPDDRVRLFAIDLNAINMTKQLVAPTSKEMQAGLGKLEQRAPLGSTDLLAALRTALDSFPEDSTRPRSIIYIGDGVDRIQSAQFDAAVKQLVGSRISVTSLAIGPQRDGHLLATLANHTGGIIFFDSDRNTAQQAGLALARATRGTVLWPTSANLPAAMTEVYPKATPPLRTDRDSVMVGLLDNRGPHEVRITYSANGKSIEQRWQVTGEESHPDFSFLPELVSLARRDDGLTLPTAGSAALREASRVMGQSAQQLATLGEHALKTGDLVGAQNAAAAAIARDPSNPRAIAVQNAARKFAANPEALGERLVNVQADAAPAAQPGLVLGDGDAGEGRFLDLVESAQQVQAEILQSEVEAGLGAARQKMSNAPESAIQDLKILLERVERAPDLNADARTQLRDRIESAIREAGRMQIEYENQRADAEENEAAGVEARRIAQETFRRRRKIKQLLDRFGSLLAEGKYESAELDIAKQVESLEPDSVTARVALWNARNHKNIQGMRRFRDLRHRGFVDALYQVEQAAIPFPDEPPVVYPPPEVWELITLSRKKYAAVDLGGKPGSAEERILTELNSEASFDYIDSPLKDVIEDIAFSHDIPIVIDTRALEDFGIGTDTPITKSLKGVSLRSALRLMLSELDLTYMIQDEVMHITTPEEAEGKLVTKVYPVGDLVIPVMSGGMGGGMMGGGGMGGGMGGGGMGGGGMGGGGRGGGGNMFAVGEELSLGADKKKATTPAKKPSGHKPRIIKLPAKAGESRYQAWDRHFNEHRLDSPADRIEHQRRVRETVRSLRAQAQIKLNADDVEGATAKLEEVVILTQAALRHGQPQQWMYEAMTLALLASGSPIEEVERALMSAVDFTHNHDELLYVADYMARLGLDSRALKLYQELSIANPLQPDPYMKGLAVAQRIDDEAGIQWACAGILSQAWPKNSEQVAAKANRVAEALLTRMISEKRLDDAKAFKARLDEAMIRDCMIRVTWTGDADVDLLVEEPTATVCSLHNPRTTSGGVMLGDAFANASGDSVEGFSEVYVCPKGFSGQYRLLLRRVWGEVTAGKVTVEVCTNFGTEHQTYGRQQIPLGEKDAVVNVEVNHGRRAEPLPEEKIATLQRTRQDVGRAILAQQLRGIEDSDALRDYAVAVRRGIRDGRIDPRALGRRGAVGFMPVVTPFPEGNMLFATAIISADRRYVRFTIFPIPVASGITNVDTFNFVTGQSGGGGGGGGGTGGLF